MYQLTLIIKNFMEKTIKEIYCTISAVEIPTKEFFLRVIEKKMNMTPEQAEEAIERAELPRFAPTTPIKVTDGQEITKRDKERFATLKDLLSQRIFTPRSRAVSYCLGAVISGNAAAVRTVSQRIVKAEWRKKNKMTSKKVPAPSEKPVNITKKGSKEIFINILSIEGIKKATFNLETKEVILTY